MTLKDALFESAFYVCKKLRTFRGMKKIIQKQERRAKSTILISVVHTYIYRESVEQCRMCVYTTKCWADLSLYSSFSMCFFCYFIQKDAAKRAFGPSPHLRWTSFIRSADLQIPLQLQSNEATQMLPACAFHSQSAVSHWSTLELIKLLYLEIVKGP